MDFHSVENAFQQAVAEGVFPGAVVLVSKEGSVVYEKAFGCRSLVPHTSTMELATIFDLASLTKPIATTVAFMLLIKQKKLRLDDLVTRVIPMYGVFGKNLTTFRHLPWNMPFYARLGFQEVPVAEQSPALRAVFDAETRRGLDADRRLVMRRKL